MYTPLQTTFKCIVAYYDENEEVAQIDLMIAKKEYDILDEVEYAAKIFGIIYTHYAVGFPNTPEPPQL